MTLLQLQENYPWSRKVVLHTQRKSCRQLDLIFMTSWNKTENFVMYFSLHCIVSCHTTYIKSKVFGFLVKILALVKTNICNAKII